MGVSSVGTEAGFEEKIDPPARLLDDRDLSSSVSCQLSALQHVNSVHTINS